jgi:hypothetical protein
MKIVHLALTVRAKDIGDFPFAVSTGDNFIYKLSHIKFHCVIGRRRITIQLSPSILVQFNM